MATLDVSDIISYLGEHKEIADTGVWARENKYDHNDVVSKMKILQATEFVKADSIAPKGWELEEEGDKVLADGSPEAQLYNAIVRAGAKATKEAIVKIIPEVTYNIGFAQAMRQKWISIDKATGVVTALSEKKDEAARDETKENLKKIQEGKEIDVAVATLLKKRQLCRANTRMTFRIVPGPKYQADFVKPVAELTTEMLNSGAWKTQVFKQYAFGCLGTRVEGGHLHPLAKVRAEYRQVFLEMGFSEMPTNRWVESSFWNFDALFQPQQHPARDAHDTFFLNYPAETREMDSLPEYKERVKKMHESGDGESIGYRYQWQEAEAKKNILRTHTTAVSTRMLYKLGQEGFKPSKCFSIDRVFRNEALDQTHLAEFHQIEGWVADYNLTLGDLIGTISEFFRKVGVDKLRFKPAYNPYTEPSMEIFSYHPTLKKWVEIGNSGVFRPEMLKPMGIPEGVRVIAWGFGLERPTMIKYKIRDIRDLCGHKLSLPFVNSHPIVRLDKE